MITLGFLELAVLLAALGAFAWAMRNRALGRESAPPPTPAAQIIHPPPARGVGWGTAVLFAGATAALLAVAGAGLSFATYASMSSARHAAVSAEVVEFHAGGAITGLESDVGRLPHAVREAVREELRRELDRAVLDPPSDPRTPISVTVERDGRYEQIILAPHDAPAVVVARRDRHRHRPEDWRVVRRPADAAVTGTADAEVTAATWSDADAADTDDWYARPAPADRAVVSGGLFATEAEARADALAKAAGLLGGRAGVNGWRPDGRLAERFVRRTAVEPITRTTRGENEFTVYRAHLLVATDAPAVGEVAAAYRREFGDRRAGVAAILFGLLTAGVGVTAWLFRANLKYGPVRRGRRRLAAGAALGTIGAVAAVLFVA